MEIPLILWRGIINKHGWSTNRSKEIAIYTEDQAIESPMTKVVKSTNHNKLSHNSALKLGVKEYCYEDNVPANLI
jgi:hypothetical protein